MWRSSKTSHNLGDLTTGQSRKYLALQLYTSVPRLRAAATFPGLSQPVESRSLCGVWTDKRHSALASEHKQHTGSVVLY